MTQNIKPEFANGVTFQKRPKQPTFIVGQLGVNVEKFTEWIKDKKGWINLDIKEKKSGDGYFLQVNNWKPEKRADKSKGEVDNIPEEPLEFNGGEIPF